MCACFWYNFATPDALENGGPVKDVRTLLVQFKKALLADVVVLFSRVFPESESRPHLHPMWRLAESLGAKCASHLGPEVTHVVAAAPGALLCIACILG